MIVRDLILKLQEFNGDLEVEIADWSEGELCYWPVETAVEIHGVVVLGAGE